jgi:hypothetical protein
VNGHRLIGEKVGNSSFIFERSTVQSSHFRRLIHEPYSIEPYRIDSGPLRSGRESFLSLGGDDQVGSTGSMYDDAVQVRPVPSVNRCPV